MDVFKHHDVSVDAKAEFAAHALQSILEGSTARVSREQAATVITTKRYEMRLSALLITHQAPRHELSVDG
jgi:hypothetical protein